MHIRTFFSIMALLALYAQSFSVSAISVFQWVDSDGVTHFSEDTPADATAVKQLSHYEIDENYPQGRDPEEDYFSIINQWKRTNDERESRVKLNRQNRQARRFVPPQPQARSSEQPSQRYYSGLVPSPYLYNRGRFQHRNSFINSPAKQPMKATPSQPLPGFVGNVGGRGL